MRRTYWSSLVRYGRHHHPPVEYHTSFYHIVLHALYISLSHLPTSSLPRTLTRGGAQVLEAAFSHTLSQVSSQAGLTAEQSKLWSVFMSCGLDHLSTILPQDNDIGTYLWQANGDNIMKHNIFMVKI